MFVGASDPQPVCRSEAQDTGWACDWSLKGAGGDFCGTEPLTCGVWANSRSIVLESSSIVGHRAGVRVGEQLDGGNHPQIWSQQGSCDYRQDTPTACSPANSTLVISALTRLSVPLSPAGRQLRAGRLACNHPCHRRLPT